MDEADTDPLRNLAPKWCLAGDDKLLTILQNTHQKILSNSQNVNSKLDEMAASLNKASISLQNVNNKFMALSNSQFIESRVYDDDEDIAAETKPIKEQPQPPTAESELTMIKRSLSVLESMHEVVTILRDSDTESDSDDDAVARVVMKPKDLYARRPLPYIIGSQAWKNKWHAGLLVEDSESDSSTSKPDRDSEQYSESEPEPELNADPDGNIQTDRLGLPDQTISETSSDLVSEQDIPTPAVVKPSPSDVAAELARRLGGHLPKPHVEQQTPVEYVPPRPAVQTVYRPHQPAPGNVFSDEPPPIDQYESFSSEEDGDIFAELHKKQPYKENNAAQSRVADDLFDFNNKNEGDIFSDFATNKVPIPSAKPKTALFEDESEPELFAGKPETKPLNNNLPTESDTGAVKKPVGGISLFGNNKGAESIGAAILKRNQRKSSSNDESDDEPIKPQTKAKPKPKPIAPQTNPVKPETKVTQNEPVKNEKDIFDDLFAKSEILQKKDVVNKEKKVDLFSDNLFDDIDDIFTSNVVKTNTKTDKPIFDDTEDLFADIAVAKTNNNDKKKENKGLFDSDDDLFAENDKIEPKITVINEKKETKIASEPQANPSSVLSKITPNIDVSNDESKKVNTEQNKQQNKSKEIEIIKETKSIFDDDSSDNDMFTNSTTAEPKTTKLPERDSLNTGILNKTKDKSEEEHSVVVTKNTEVTKVTKSVFDDDSSDNDMFANSTAEPKTTKLPERDSLNTRILNKTKDKSEQDHSVQVTKNTEVTKVTKSVFDDDSSDNDMFTNSTTEPKTIKLPEKDSLTTGILNITKDNNDEEISVGIKKTVVTQVATTKSIFDDDSDTDIFANIKTTKNKTDIVETKSFHETTQIINETKNDLLKKEDEPATKTADNLINDKMQFNSPSLFDDEDEELFAKSDQSISDIKKDRINIVKGDTDVAKVDSLLVPQQTSQKVSETVKPQDSEQAELPDINQIAESDEFTSKLDDVPIDDAQTDIAWDEPPPFEIQSKEDPIEEDIESKTQEPDIFNDDIPAPDPIDDTGNDILFAAGQGSVLSKPDVFTDIFTEPPEFEKVKEPKSSQNVNALFGDDSDDEALFFKKDDIISDDKPDTSVPIVSTDMFGLFVDEPPAIDVNFVTKSDQNDGIFDSNDDLFQSLAINKETVDTVEKILPVDPETVKDIKKELPKSKIEDAKSEGVKIDGTQAPDNDNKKIGKLKTMNFKIDVNALLPGRSPKKKIYEQVDGQSVSISNEELPTNNDKIESKLVKSVSFEGKPDSEVLDNKLSKERARIQVKRRPSTRRARREAVRKSAIDLDNDSTDNSSSIDDPPKSRRVLNKIEKKTDLTVDQTENNDLTKARDVKSKVVYILNDEDIFNTKPDAKIEDTDVVTPKLDKMDNIHASKTVDFQSKDIIDSESTLASVNKENPTVEPSDSLKSKEPFPVKPNSSVFGELSEDDDALFGKNKTTAKKANIFQSDSDDDLFTGKSKSKSKKETVERKREVVVKGSLFGDDDDDDMFGVKTKKISEPIPQSSKSTTREPSKSTEAVFDDPLSMLEDDD